jgi:hypothetical protein
MFEWKMGTNCKIFMIEYQNLLEKTVNLESFNIFQKCLILEWKIIMHCFLQVRFISYFCLEFGPDVLTCV